MRELAYRAALQACPGSRPEFVSADLAFWDIAPGDPGDLRLSGYTVKGNGHQSANLFRSNRRDQRWCLRSPMPAEIGHLPVTIIPHSHPNTNSRLPSARRESTWECAVRVRHVKNLLAKLASTSFLIRARWANTSTLLGKLVPAPMNSPVDPSHTSHKEFHGSSHTCSCILAILKLPMTPSGSQLEAGY